jgi:hypothetical protein
VTTQGVSHFSTGWMGTPYVATYHDGLLNGNHCPSLSDEAASIHIPVRYFSLRRVT